MIFIEVLDLCRRWAKRVNVVKTVVERFRQIDNIGIIKGTRPPAGTEDLFLYWGKQNPSEKELKKGLSHPDPFVRMRSLYLGHQKGMVDEARLDQAAKSDDWPERLISRMINPAITPDEKIDHVRWANVCLDMDAEQTSPLIRWLREDLKNRFVVNPKDGSILVQIPAGRFEMGGGRNRDNPKHMVHLDTYYIAVFAVTNRQYKVFVDETGHRPPDKATWGTPIWKGNAYPLEYADHPVVCVSWDDATAYSNWAGLSLPTEAQWEKAARGPQGFIHPWGNQLDERKCRNESNKGSGTSSPVYGYSTGASGYGTYNQSGNVWEWCSDCYGSDYYNSSPRANPHGPSLGSYRVVRGGSWDDIADWCRAAYRSDYNPSCRDGNLGFRCVLAQNQQFSR